ncbi:MAG: class I tRNA ligase family protein, partial [Rhodoglobus sp.]
DPASSVIDPASSVIDPASPVIDPASPVIEPVEIPSAVTDPLDLDMLAGLSTVIATATAALEDYDHAKALETTEQFFWTFCDDYLEVVKERAYGASTEEGQASAVVALRTAIDILLRLFAPYLPFATEEVWSWTHEGSVHTASWPTTSEVGTDAAPSGLFPAVSAALISIRRAKTDAKASQKTDVVSATIAGPAILADALGDLRAVGRIANVEFVESDAIEVRDIVLAVEPTE